jgi:hypothetical protein
MFNDPFQPQSVTALQASPHKEVPKRPKSPPKIAEEWILSQTQEEQNQELSLHGLNVKKKSDLQDGGHFTAAEAWPKRAPKGERLLEESERKDKANMIFGSLENIKEDIKSHARTYDCAENCSVVLMHLYLWVDLWIHSSLVPSLFQYRKRLDTRL